MTKRCYLCKEEEVTLCTIALPQVRFEADICYECIAGVRGDLYKNYVMIFQWEDNLYTGRTYEPIRCYHCNTTDHVHYTFDFAALGINLLRFFCPVCGGDFHGELMTTWGLDAFYTINNFIITVVEFNRGAAK